MEPLRLITIILDVLLVVFAALALFYRPRIGGQLAVGLRLAMLGVLILGLSHLGDTLLNAVVTIDRPVNAILHRAVNVFGFLFVFVGFFNMRRAFDA